MRKINTNQKEINDVNIQYPIPEYVYHPIEFDLISNPDTKFSFNGKKGKLLPRKVKKIFERKKTQTLQKNKLINWRLSFIPALPLSKKKYKSLAKYKEEIAKEYMEAIEKNGKIIPNIYCSYEWIKNNPRLIPVEDTFGYKGFLDYTSKKFFIPPYKKINDEYFFRKEDAVYTFPNSIAKDAGLRRDVMYVYSREATLATLSRIPRLKEDKNKSLYSCFPLLYTEGNKSKWNEKISEYFWNITTKNHFVVALSLNPRYFQKALFNDVGLNRFICMENDKILGVILWSDNGVFINIHYGIAKYNKSMNEEIKKNNLINPFIIMRWCFMERFPRGTLFNDGGCLFSNFARRNKEVCNPVHIYEIRTHYNIDSYQYIHNGELKRLQSVGRLKSEF